MASYTGQFLRRYYSLGNGQLTEIEPEEDVLSVETDSAPAAKANMTSAPTRDKGKIKVIAKSAEAGTKRSRKIGRP